MRRLFLTLTAALCCASPALAGDLNKELTKSQTGLKNFFDPMEKKIHDSGPEGQKAAKAAQKAEPKKDEAKAQKQVQTAGAKLKLPAKKK